MGVADPAVAHDQDAVGERDRLVDVVGDEQHRGMVLPAQLADQVVHPDPGDRVQRGERLVEQDQLRFGHQGARQRHALRLTARKLFGPGLFAIGKMDVGQRFASPLFGIRSPQSQGDVAKNALPRQQPVALEHDRTLGGNLDAAAVGPVQAGEQSQQRALAAARGTQQDDELLVLDREVQVVQHGAVAERADDLLDQHAGPPTRGGHGRGGHTAS